MHQVEVGGYVVHGGAGDVSQITGGEIPSFIICPMDNGQWTMDKRHNGQAAQ